MNTSNWFDDIPVLGALPLAQAAAKLYDMGEEEVAERIVQEMQETSYTFSSSWLEFSPSLRNTLWSATGHIVGHIAPSSPGTISLSISAANSIHAEQELKKTRIKITLDRLRAASYPGKGMHRVLLHCYAQNQVPGTIEDVHFNTIYRIQEGDYAGIQGHPIFVGLNVGNEGVSFRFRTINMTNEQDEAFLSFLESDVFKAGLKLSSIAQPALAPLSEMALGIAKMIATRHKNVSIQDYDLGLDFSQITTRTPLAQGSYIVVQIPERERVLWNWEEWIYQRTNDLIVKKDNLQEILPYNYLIFGVSRYDKSD